ncbi:MAG: hypothetical protein IH956_09580 [Chloroflexi bacterium]|nr:hypothetical protein [Chloroflexota bacterium]
MISEHRPARRRSRTSFLALRIFAVLGIMLAVALIGLIGYSMASLWGESTDRASYVANNLAPPPKQTPLRQASLWTLIKLREWEHRSLAFGYWEALNDYDADKALSFLEEGYRSKREGDIREQIELLRLSSGQLVVTEQREPFMVSSTEAVMFFSMGDPPDTDRIQMTIVRVDDGWKILYAGEPQ